MLFKSPLLSFRLLKIDVHELQPIKSIFLLVVLTLVVVAKANLISLRSFILTLCREIKLHLLTLLVDFQEVKFCY